jgi:hypothetical protein
MLVTRRCSSDAVGAKARRRCAPDYLVSFGAGHITVVWDLLVTPHQAQFRRPDPKMADDVVIRAEGLGKKYMIGHTAEREQYVALRDELIRGARNLWRKTADMVRGRPIVAGDTNNPMFICASEASHSEAFSNWRG